jgi:hypothetical protein
MEVIELWPPSQGEVNGRPDLFVDAPFRRGPAIDHSSRMRKRDYLSNIERHGGMLRLLPTCRRSPFTSKPST